MRWCLPLLLILGCASPSAPADVIVKAGNCVVIENSGCPPCERMKKETLPVLKKTYKSVRFIVVNAAKSPVLVHRLLHGRRVVTPTTIYYYDKEGQLRQRSFQGFQKSDSKIWQQMFAE